MTLTPFLLLRPLLFLFTSRVPILPFSVALFVVVVVVCLIPSHVFSLVTAQPVNLRNAFSCGNGSARRSNLLEGTVGPRSLRSRISSIVRCRTAFSCPLIPSSCMLCCARALLRNIKAINV